MVKQKKSNAFPGSEGWLFQKPLAGRASMVFSALRKVALSRGATICRLG
jgi:hypothetical protein